MPVNVCPSFKKFSVPRRSTSLPFPFIEPPFTGPFLAQHPTAQAASGTNLCMVFYPTFVINILVGLLIESLCSSSIGTL